MQLHHNELYFEEIAENISEEHGVSIDIVRKDYFVSLFLKNYLKYEPNLVFKGGTSLLKCFDVIDRFSEDIDITFINDGGKLSEGQRRRVNHNVLKVCVDMGFKVLNKKDIKSRRLFNQYIVDTGYMANMSKVREEIIVEIALQTIPFPIVNKEVNNYMTAYLLGNEMVDEIREYEMDLFSLSVQSIERTFMDKVFSFCDYHITRNYNETSRHIYDLYKLWPIISEDLTKEMIEDVRKDRSKLSVCPSAVSGISINNLLQDIINGEVYKDDYENNTNRLLFEELEYVEAVSVLDKVIKTLLFE